MALLPTALLVRRLPQAADADFGFFSPSLDGGLPLLLLFSPSRRSNSAMRATSAAFSSRSNAFSAWNAANRIAAEPASASSRGACVAGRCHRHVDSYSAVTCQSPPSKG